MSGKDLVALIRSTRKRLNNRADMILSDAFMQKGCAELHSRASEQFEVAAIRCGTMLEELMDGASTDEREEEMRAELSEYAALLGAITVPEALSNLARAVAASQLASAHAVAGSLSMN